MSHRFDSLDEDGDVDIDDGSEHVALTAPRDSSSGVSSRPAARLLGSPNYPDEEAANGASIAGNGSSFGVGGEGALVSDDEDEEVEIDSDIENELAAAHEEELRAQGGADVPQRCDNKLSLYLAGFIGCLACEFLILLMAYYLHLWMVSFLYIVAFVSLATAAVSMGVCPARRKPHSLLSTVLYTAAVAAFVGGMWGAAYYKQVWYFSQHDSAYSNVNPHIDPNTGMDWSGAGTPTQAVASPLEPPPTFLDFEQAISNDISQSFTSFVWRRFARDNSTIVGLSKEVGTTFCAAPITHTQTKYNPHPTIFYWAVSKDCCGDNKDGSAAQLWTDCKYWGDNIPGVTQIVDLSAEVIEQQEHKMWRQATLDFMDRTKLPYAWNSNSSLLVEVMTLADHYDRQKLRRYKAYIVMLSAALLWPVFFFAFQQVVAIGQSMFGKQRAA